MCRSLILVHLALELVYLAHQMGDLELDYRRLAALNPRLVYIAASGWGQTGPYSQLAGLDIMAQAMSGLMSITGEEGRDPVKVGVPMCDLVCALYGALAAVSALRARERDGCGRKYESAFAGSCFSRCGRRENSCVRGRFDYLRAQRKYDRHATGQHYQ